MRNLEWMNLFLASCFRQSNGFVLCSPGTLSRFSVSRKAVIEVEQKFSFGESSDVVVEDRLQDIGFVKSSTISFIDWYFDSSDLHLTARDAWLRYRQQGEPGMWQLKEGINDGSKVSVYRETEGIEAFSKATAFIPEPSTLKESQDLFDGITVPGFPAGISHRNIEPFCRINTTRSSWVVNPTNPERETFEGLSVDLDITDTGYSIGEVEAVLESESEVPNAKQRIGKLIECITGKPTIRATPPAGKLEYYLMMQRPEHYKMCLERDLFKEQT